MDDIKDHANARRTVYIFPYEESRDKVPFPIPLPSFIYGLEDTGEVAGTGRKSALIEKNSG